MFEEAAKRLGLPVSVIRAVALVESSGKGFDASGRCVLRFEPHIFSAYSHGKFDASHPKLSNPVFSPQRFGGWPEYEEAVKLDANAAMLACSWGMFQIMGFNFSSCGFSSVGAFVEAHQKSESAQLDAWCQFLISQKLIPLLQSRDWAAFARRYNGEGYSVNHYDSRIRDAVELYEKGVYR